MELDKIPVVKEFRDMLQEELSCLPLQREVEFTIELILRASPISMALYRMAPSVMRE